MKKVPSLLMKELKYIQSEIERILNSDSNESTGPLDDQQKDFLFDNGYSYEENKQALAELYDRELKIRGALSKFNSTYVIEEVGLTMSEALVRIAQLQRRAKVLRALAGTARTFKNQNSIYERRCGDVNRIRFDKEAVKADLQALQDELTKLQVAVDKVNLYVQIEY